MRDMFVRSCISALVLLFLGKASSEAENCEITAASLISSLRSGDWVCARTIMASDAVDADTLRSIFDSENRAILFELGLVKAVMDKKDVQSTVYMSPAFQWAQSPYEVFLSVKFSHKLDAPATLNVQPNITLEEDRLFLEGSNGLKGFRLDLPLSDSILTEESNWTASSNGRITVTLKKANPGKWKQLLQEGVKKPPNMHSWLDKQDSYELAFEHFDHQKKFNDSLAAVPPPLPGTVHEPDPEHKKMAEKSQETMHESMQRGEMRTAQRKVALEALEKERFERLVEVSRRAKADKAAIEREIAEKKKALGEAPDEPLRVTDMDAGKVIDTSKEEL